MKNTFQEDLNRAVAYHGHLCGGQIIGVRMGRYGCSLLGIEDPQNFRDLVVYIECDRCLTDAIGTVTNCKLGKRTLKWRDYGKSAATFLNLQTGEAYRIYKKFEQRTPKDADPVAFFDALSDEDLFSCQKVRVRYDEGDLPGRPTESVNCARCGEKVTDGRHSMVQGEPLCQACFPKEPVLYYEIIEEN